MGYLEGWLRGWRVGYRMLLTLFTNAITLHRSAQQVTDRLDELIRHIRKLQRPSMRGGKPADIVLVG